MANWTQKQALELAYKIEEIAPECGAHVALTGGCLYKGGKRKDADFLFYRIRQVEAIDTAWLFQKLDEIGVYLTAGGDHGWCVKAGYMGKPVDLLFPERDGKVQGCHDPEISRAHRDERSEDFEVIEDDILA